MPLLRLMNWRQSQPGGSRVTLCLKIVCSIGSRSKICLQGRASYAFMREEVRQGEAVVRL